MELTLSEAIDTNQLPAGWVAVPNKANSFKKTYAQNTTETAVFKDLAGNAVSVGVNVKNIDKVEPVVSIAYSSKEQTNKPVTVTLKTNKPSKTPAGWTRVSTQEFTKTYATNTTETVTVVDESGNSTTQQIKIDNIDTPAPQEPTDVKFSDDGTKISGQAESGTTVEVKNEAGEVIGTTTAGQDGKFEVKLSPALTNGETISIQISDPAGNQSQVIKVTAPVVKPAPTTPKNNANSDSSNNTNADKPSQKSENNSGNLADTGSSLWLIGGGFVTLVLGAAVALRKKF